MAHCPPELLDDLAEVFAEVRTWAGVVEKKPGVFYVRRQPFLHFHLLAGSRRCADVKVRTDWVRLDLPRPTSPMRRRAFLGELRRRYRTTRTMGGLERAPHAPRDRRAPGGPERSSILRQSPSP